MASSKTAEREARAARDRLRRYNARQAVYTHKVKRRLRDNVVSIVVGVVVVALAAFTQVLYFTSGPGVPPAPAPTASTDPVDEGANVGDVPDPALAESRIWTGELALNDVALGIELDGGAAPQAVASFVQGVNEGYYTGKTCHRLVDEVAFLVQCGSLTGDGATDPSYAFGPIENVPADDIYPAGTIAMARADSPYSNGRQFFIVYEDTELPGTTGGYTVFGTVTSGLDQLIEKIASQGVVDGAHDGAPVIATTITRVSVN